MDRPHLMVSVIIPTYNYAAYVSEAINSVLAQTYPNFELIVVDDGSTDHTKTVLESYGDTITCVFQQNLGLSAARNSGMRQARGELIALLDADDIWLPDKLERQVQFAAAHGDVALFFGDGELFNERGTITASFLSQSPIAPRLNAGELVIKDAFRLLLKENFIIPSTALVRRACIEHVGGFDESLRLGEDRDLWLRISRHFPIGYVPASLIRRRVHDSNLSADTLLLTRSLIKVLEKAAVSVSNSRAELRAGLGSILASHYFSLGYHYFDRGDYKKARQHLLISLSRRLQVKPLAYYVATLLGKRVVMWARNVKRHSGRKVSSVG